MSERLKIIPYDTTLRDGGQGAEASLTVGNKLRITQRLDSVGFPYIEGGWPGSNPVDNDFFQEVTGLKLNGELVAFGMTGRIGVNVENDDGLNALLKTETGIITIFGKSWMRHVENVLRTSGNKNLDIIYNTVQFLKDQGRKVFFDAEHFFDGANPQEEGGDLQYALKTLEAAQKGGAEVIILCDTRGGSTPEFVYETTQAARKRLGENFPLGIHAHNDGGLAVANTIAAIKAGARQVQGTINGMGERAGNVDLCVFLPTAALKYDFDIGGIDLTQITELSRFVELETGIAVPGTTPYTGRDAFGHKAGAHVAAEERDPGSYTHIYPEFVGQTVFFKHSDQGGGANVLKIARKYGVSLSRNDPEFQTLVDEMKKLRVLGDTQEYLLLHRFLFKKAEPFDILPGTKVDIPRDSNSTAIVRVRVNGDEYIETAESGEGELDAFDQALKKALSEKYPEVNEVKLLNYNVRLSPGAYGTGAEVVVYIEFGSNGYRWTSTSLGKDVVITNQNALIDGYKYHLLRNKITPPILDR